MNLTKGLNPEQKKAVRADEGVYLVLAGAGTGKTRVLVHRAAYLVKTGIRPEKIVLLTFTRKAADEMVYRASKIGSGSCKRIQSGTFHSFCLDLLKRYGAQIGLTKFTLLDGPTAEDAVRSVRNTYMKDNDVPARGFPRAGTLNSISSFSTETRVSVATAIETRWPDHEPYAEHIAAILEEYKEFKSDRKYIDFSDILSYAVELFKTSFMQRLAKTDYHYLMIDEYQDTNVMQDELVRLMAVNGNLMVVGDDMQSIYGFRGAHAENIIEFPERWPKAKIIKLVRNYRSYEPILDVANSISADAVSRPELYKELVAYRGEGPRPQMHIAECRFSQAKYVKKHIDTLIESGVRPKDIAVLFRSGNTSNELETILSAESMEYATHTWVTARYWPCYLFTHDLLHR
jgi:DNA helicase-2/ATP-dependent DNA helicase PcrA